MFKNANQLNLIFQTSSRDEITLIAAEIAKVILAQLTNNDRPKPIVIGLTGTGNAGKSIIWDIVRVKLLHDGGIFISAKSESYQTRCLQDGLLFREEMRRFETWVGQTAPKSPQLKLFKGNLNALYWMNNSDLHHYIHDCKDGLNGKTLNDLGDIILLSNLFERFLPPEQYDLIIDLRNNPQKRNWERRIEMITPKQSIFVPLFQ